MLSVRKKEMGKQNKPKHLFKPSPDKEAAVAALKSGMSIKDAVKTFKVTERTIWNYAQELKRADPQFVIITGHEEPIPNSRKKEKEADQMSDEEQELENQDEETGGGGPGSRAATGGNGKNLSGTVQLQEGSLIIQISIPPVVMTIFDYGKAAKLIAEEMDLDTFLFECVLKRFELDYKYRLALMPIIKES